MKLRIVSALGQATDVTVADKDLQLPELREAVAKQLSLPLDRLKLVKDGAAVAGAAVKQLRDGDTILAVVAPRPPPQRLLDLSDGGAEDEDDAMLRLRLPANAPQWKRQLAGFLQQRLRFPEFVVAALFSVSWKFWVGIVCWGCLSRAAAAFELGPIFIVCTVFLLILMNLGVRQEGSLSAYSLFNTNLRQLPGQITAEHLDGQLRHGQM